MITYLCGSLAEWFKASDLGCVDQNLWYLRMQGFESLSSHIFYLFSFLVTNGDKLDKPHFWKIPITVVAVAKRKLSMSSNKESKRDISCPLEV